jgi:thiamine kinase-like enzyme
MKAKILHRDISVGNILITSQGNGILIDWELSKDLNQTTEWVTISSLSLTL